MTYLCPSPDGVHIAVGYEDGGVRIFNLLNGESNISFSGHKSVVSVIRYDALGARLVTGSRVRLQFKKKKIFLFFWQTLIFGQTKVIFYVVVLQDTDVIMWDIINECGLYRLKGHKDEVTQVLFLENKNLLITR